MSKQRKELIYIDYLRSTNQRVDVYFSMNRYSRKDLEQLPLAALAKVAREYGVPPMPGRESYELIQLILEAQEEQLVQAGTAVGEQSGFIRNTEDFEPSPAADHSTFFGQENGARAEKPDTAGSAFFRDKPTENGSVFLSSADEPQSINIDTSVHLNSAPGFLHSEVGSGRPVQGAKKSKEHNLGAGDELVLGGTAYRITDIISDSSGEAIIYKVQEPGGGLKVVKLYFEINPRVRPEPNAEALNRILGIDHPDVLKLHRFGTGAHKYQGRYCYEVSAYAEGGNLLDVPDFKQKYTAAFVEQQLVPEIFNGIKVLHSRRIVHCDLKPQNIFFLDRDRQDLVIGDYGSAVTFEESAAHDQPGGRQVSEVIGTRLYMAPEQMQGIISEANDYFSFGMVLLHLFYPEHLALDRDRRIPDNAKKRQIIENQYAQKEIVPYNPAYDRLNQLIGGLTLYAHGARWGRDEVERWIKGEYLQVQYQGKSLVQPIKLGRGVDIVAQQDLTAYFEKEPERWYPNLILDAQGYSSLLGWLYSRTDLQVKQVFEQMVRFYRPLGDEYTKEAVLRYFIPERPILFGGQAFDLYGAEHIRTQVEALIVALDRHWKETPLKNLRFVLFQLEFCLRQALASHPAHSEKYEAIIQKISRGLGQNPDAALLPFTTQWQNALPLNDPEKSFRALLDLFYAVIPNRNFRGHVYQEIAEVKQLGFFFAQDRNLFADQKIKLEALYFLSKKNRPDLTTLLKDYDQFLFTLFAEDVRAKIEVHQVDVSPERTYQIEYSAWRSLTDFFQKNQISYVLETKAQEKFRFSYQRPFGKTISHAFDTFVGTLPDRHQVDANRIEAPNLAEARRTFSRLASPQEIRHHASEFYSAAILVIPLLFGLGLFFMETQEGYSLGQTLFYQFRYDLTANGPAALASFGQAHRASLHGLLVGVAMWYLAAIFAKLWLRERLALIGEVKDGSPPLLHLNGYSGFKALLLVFGAPLLFFMVNWAYTLIGGVLLMVAGAFVKGQIYRRSDLKRNIVGLLLVVVGVVQLATWSAESAYQLGWLAFTVLIFFGIPVFYQHGKSSVGRDTWVKVGALAVLAIFILPLTSVHDGWRNLRVRSAPPVEAPTALAEETIAGAWLATVADGIQLVNVRAGQGTAYGVVGQVGQGQEFAMRPIPNSRWVKIQTPENVTGYVNESMVRTVRPLRKSDNYPAY